MYEDLKKRFEEIGIIPVVVLEDAKDAHALGEALMKGGLPAAEVTFRTEAAEEVIRILSKDFPDMLVGAGTVLTCEQADRAVAAGAKFIVAPGFNPTVVKHCLEKGYPVTPGVQTPGEMEQAMELGLDFVKFFPAEPAGGLPMIKAVAAPYSKLRFMPTGGINKENVKDYLAYKKIVACGGTWMVKGDLIASGDFAKIEELTHEAAEIVKEARA
ncbi:MULTISPECIES: bifunctional 4-hydroxy-2-oxoglutarate aldolase/2-dehydro-3-deoxy-phosphogluconate aldolase [Pseudobutyrivibrio]|jgi:2-dehydro-3-deoxyphosphogluconate aldolase/(4S)-4-hydroxy-2-oxoglutarate aldolase|uniref:2-dehydro-3-deoxy-phosphogluconate aldolase n=2 Tax=Pseudobutyrivibrio TaxID=46205 RepID=A0A2G3DSQ7_9FIRM|nr:MULTISPECIES: bifunctional 4-hydroxy-2-oxoglutarate aldolase/2-dehydro-3-deoxy-phosphogluconate aldolase [Pseudobutyrivibrio]MBE5904673.1 bifunctional 4-hydroxy-2-oxoglutarate aldolase/2-dehydro-3-deoxy-phosphogluconate aldolase [Pseudobutyrivibrio sp.]NEX02191.1 bifunctional 4-hydroxy-2-oxoglutarate aldolase/2-dehydro-3-deoxy-phosphogluconate aldolase [Pseudobutyrivibrio xylanivorans]PHU33923.1 2-dehydro-3-deoxyphosphogluconate aldolase [Pseudobutyrivibrio ruminis]PHU40789.1 2-dehydro-3-deo